MPSPFSVGKRTFCHHFLQSIGCSNLFCDPSPAGWYNGKICQKRQTIKACCVDVPAAGKCAYTVVFWLLGDVLERVAGYLESWFQFKGLSQFECNFDDSFSVDQWWKSFSFFGGKQGHLSPITRQSDSSAKSRKGLPVSQCGSPVQVDLQCRFCS